MLSLFFILLLAKNQSARERALSRFGVLSLAHMKKRKQHHEQVLAANGNTSGVGGLQKRKGNGFAVVVGGGGTAAGVENGTYTSLPAPSPNRLARFQSERASLPIWLARKQLLAEVTEGHRDSFLSSFLFFVSLPGVGETKALGLNNSPLVLLPLFFDQLLPSPRPSPQLRAHDTVILVGETGSGKSTQLPQLMLDAGLAGSASGSGRNNDDNKGTTRRPPPPPRIAVTQPRRVAASTVARRVAAERGSALGGEVGYAVRFVDATSPSTRIKFLTDGMLLREALLDPLLSRYGAVLLDEAHERTVQTDVLFGLVKAAQ